jgi:ribose transport system ATP-binding protein
LAEDIALRLGRYVPILGLLGLITALALYTDARNPAFHSSFNLNGLLIATLPMACVAMGQTSALMVKAFDVSAGALMGFCVVIASFVLRPEAGWPELLLGMLLVIAIAVGVAAVNVFLIRTLGLSSIIATLATMSVLEGASLWLRPQPEGIVSSKFVDAMFAKIGFVPYAFIGVVVVAVLADFWLYRTSGGLAARAAGLDETSAVRRGVRVKFLFTRAFFIVALGAGIGAFFLAAQVGVGDPNVGSSFTLTSIAAAVLGGASLLGGRGSFIGAVVGALFLNVVINVLPFLGWSSAYGRIMIGIFTLVALTLYQAPELLARARQEIANARVSRTTAAAVVAP